jgi:hypothetical protein
MADIKSDDDLVQALNEMQHLFDTIDSLRGEVVDDSVFNEMTKPMMDKFNILQESCSKYVDDNTVIEKNEEEQI